MDTKELTDLAEQLGKALIDHPAVKKYADASKSMGDDAEASRLFTDFDREVATLSQQEQSGMGITAGQQQKLQALQTRLAGNLRVKAFSMAQVELTDLLRKISSAWQRPLAEVQAKAGGGAPGGGGAPASRLVAP